MTTGNADFTSEDTVGIRTTGEYQSTSAGGEHVRAYVPHALAEHAPDLPSEDGAGRL